MDPQDTTPPAGRFETFDANPRFVVVRDDDGYGVWRLEELGEGEPIQRFADDDAGYELASDSGQRSPERIGAVGAPGCPS